MVEPVFDEAEFLCPKVYRARIGERWILQAKGASLRSQLEQSEPQKRHTAEALIRWCVYARDISPLAAEIASRLTKTQMRYYGSAESGLLGWRSGVRNGDISCVVSILDRMARHPDSKRYHREGQKSFPLYIEGAAGESMYYDCRTLDPESLIEMELSEHYADHHKQNVIDADPNIYR